MTAPPRADASGTPAPVVTPDAAASAAHDRLPWVLALAGALGFSLGVFVFPNWQVAVETAQVVAGLVAYPDDNPFFLYHMRLWTVLHQVCAVLLRAGVSEIAISLLLSGIVGMVSLQALAVITYAFSRSVALSVAASFAILISRVADVGVAYPVALVGTMHTYGVMGLSTAILAVALMAAGWLRAGAFLLGLLPAIHVALGIWMAAIGAIVLLVWPRARRDLRPGLPGLVAGVAVAAASLLLHLATTTRVPPVDPALTEPYFNMFVSYWDGHRMPVTAARDGIRVNVAVIPFALLLLAWLRHDLPQHALLLLRVAVVSASVGLAGFLLASVPPDRLPQTLVILMPMRVLNVALMLCPAALIGIMGAYAHRWWGPVVTTLAFMALALSGVSMLWDLLPPESPLAALRQRSALRPLAATALVLIACIGISRWLARTGRTVRPVATAPRTMAQAAVRVAPLVITAALFVYTVPRLEQDPSAAPPFQDWSNTPFFAELAAGDGMLLTGGRLYLVQLRTRRPVLLNGGALDSVVYTPESVLAANRILLEAYGIDLLNPPPDAWRSNTIPNDTNHEQWSRFSLERWREIGRTYGVVDVLTPSDWDIPLPLVAEHPEMRWYRIPGIE